MFRLIVFHILLVLAIGFSTGIYAQVPVDSVAVKAASEQAAPAKKKKKKLTKEEKQKIKDLDAVVKTAKYKLSKEEKKQIDRLTILEQDLNDWIKDEQAEWYCVGFTEIIPPPSQGEGTGEEPVYGELWIKEGATIQTRIFYRGVMYDGERWYKVSSKDNKLYKWRFKDLTLTAYLFNIPEEFGIDNNGIPHPEYKNYNPWEYLIELDRQAGKVSKKSPKDVQKDYEKATKQSAKGKK